ncbi:hypothetical protein V6N11_055119 [Hibiscus sabdariffa]|uniref:Uncharacterized protein n=1 Tax=Hibiscus sabdariffa TaxID=183260 RepID=A0ABR2N9C3_9ROSI
MNNSPRSKQPNKHEIETNQMTKIKLDSGTCNLVRIVSEANKAASVLAASVRRTCESRQASPGKLVLGGSLHL